MPTTEINNILSVFSSASETDRQNGENWYFDANSEARKLAREYKVPVSTVSGVLAALSPNQSWANNLTGARKALEAYSLGKSPEDVSIPTYPRNKIKAWKLLKGEPVRDVLRGPKVTAFYKNIVAPWSSTSVTVDGHAYNIWRGERVALKDGGIPNLDKAGRYEAIEADYKAAARQLGLKPWQVQAVTWKTWRRLHNIHYLGV